MMVKEQPALSAEEEAYLSSGGEMPPPGDDEAPESQDGMEGGEDAASVEKAATEPEKPKEEADPKRTKTVPHEALHAERVKARQERDQRERLEREHQQLREQYARAEERMQKMFDRLQAEERPDPKDVIPDKQTDPLGYIDYMEKRIQGIEGKWTAREQAESEERQRAQAYNEMVADAQREFNRDAEEIPHLRDAYQFLLESRQKELVNAYGYAPQYAAQVIAQEEAQIVQAARHNRRPVSSFFLSLAEARGFKPAEPPPPPEQTVEQKTAASVQKIANLERAKGAAQTLSVTGGAPAGDGKMTLETLANLPDDEFEKLISRNSKKNDKMLAKMMGLH